MPEEVGVNLFWHKNFLFDFSNIVIYNDLCACKLSYAVPDINKGCAGENGSLLCRKDKIYDARL